VSAKIQIFIQAFLTLVQVLNAGHAFGQHEQIVALSIAAVQSALAVLAHGFNPDGTKANAPREIWTQDQRQEYREKQRQERLNAINKGA